MPVGRVLRAQHARAVATSDKQSAHTASYCYVTYAYIQIYWNQILYEFISHFSHIVLLMLHRWNGKQGRCLKLAHGCACCHHGLMLLCMAAGATWGACSAWERGQGCPHREQADVEDARDAGGGRDLVGPGGVVQHCQKVGHSCAYYFTTPGCFPAWPQAPLLGACDGHGSEGRVPPPRGGRC